MPTINEILTFIGKINIYHLSDLNRENVFLKRLDL